MQIHILVNIIEKAESRHKTVLSSKYYNKYYIFYISHIFAYYVYSVHFWTSTYHNSLHIPNARICKIRN